MTKAISIDSNSSSVLYAIAFIELMRGEIEKSKNNFLKVVKIDPLHADAYAKIGMIMLREGNIEECVKNFEKAIELGGIPEVTMENICKTLEELGYKEKSKKCFKKMKD